MDNNNRLAPGFITVADAVKLVNSDTMAEPKVNISWCAENLSYLAPRHNFTIKLVKKTPEGKVVSNGNTQTYIENDYDKVILEKAILDKFRELTNRDYTRNLRKLSTTVTDKDGEANMMGRPVANSSSTTDNNTNIDGALL